MAAPPPSRPILSRWSAPGGLLPALLVLNTIAYLAWLPSGLGGDLAAWIANLGSLPLGLLAALLCARAARFRDLAPRTRQGWALLACGYLAYWLGDVLWLLHENILGERPFPSWADAAYLASYPLILAGLLRFPFAPQTPTERARFWLDSAMSLLGCGAVLWYFVLRPIARQEGSEPLATAVALAYPVMDLLLLFGILHLALRQVEARNRVALAILAYGLALFVAGDAAYAYLSLDEAYQTGTWIEATWVIGLCAVGLAAYSQCRAPGAALARVHIAPFAALPYLLPGALYLLLAYLVRDAWAEPLGGLTFAAIGSTILLVARQVFAWRETAGLLEERAEARAASQSEARFRSLVQQSSDVVTVVDGAGVIRYQSLSVRRVFGYNPDDLLGKRLAELLHPADAPRVRALLAQAATDPAVAAAIEWRLRDAAGSWRYVETTCSNLLADPHVAGLVLNSRDVSERRLLQEQLEHQAFHDPLTGLANRALFRDRVEHALARAQRGGQHLAVLFLDLDNFKAINDGLGHDAGDRVLVEVARRLQGCLRPADTVARLGGDEFAVLLDDADDPQAPAAVAERILAALGRPISLRERPLALSVSIGIASAPATGTQSGDLLRDADVAMYTAKSRGKGQYAVFEPRMQAAALSRLELAADLRRALEERQFVLHYQPIIALDSGRTSGVEALLRWRHPERGLVPPLEFIPLAEETGLIVEIGAWVLREACRQARAWQLRAAADPGLYISVNLSVRQLEQRSLVDDVRAALAASGLPANCLVLEITESMLAQDSAELTARLRTLRALGVRIAIDDFGTGFSSFGYLQRFPVDILKIDRSFVNGSEDRADRRAVLETIVALGRTLHLDTLAEGVELPAQRDLLSTLGCARGQGYLFARPLDGAAVEALLRREAGPPPPLAASA